MKKVLLITWNDLRQTLSDRTLLLLMFLAPLAVATIISVSFGNLANEASPLESIPVIVVNQDRGSPVADFGDQFVTILTSGEMQTLLEVKSGTDLALAQTSLVDGLVSAVIVLPEDLSRRLTGPASRGPAEVVIHTRPDREISADIVRSVTRQILDGFSGGLAVTQAVVGTVAQAEGVSAPGVLARPRVGEIINPGSEPPGQLIRVEVDSRRAGGVGFNPLVAFGATQAIFFALFTANANAASIMEEERDGTFVRLLATPTRKLTLLGGKLVSTIIMVIVQLILLFVAFTLIGSLLEGEMILIWGSQFGLIALTIVVTALAASGLGAIVASSSGNPEQTGIIGTVINMFMAITGGAFGFRFANPVRYASVVYWGSDAFEKLAGGGRDIGLNMVVLGAFGAGTFLAALAVFGKRFNK